MKKLTVLFIMGLLVSCRYSPKCWGDDKEKGEIIREYDAGTCFASMDTSEVVIRTKTDYLAYFSEECFAKNPINFEEESLLGFYGDGGAKVKFVREVTIDEGSKRYYYNLTIKECGGALKALEISNNLVIVPKIPDDYEVEFIKTYK